MATAVAHLAQIHAQLLEARRLDVLKVILGRARDALRCLYPEPRAASVEDQLMRLVLAAKVDC